MADNTSVRRSCAGKRNQRKVPKKVHKAEREKLKRDELNELFLDLASALELAEQNSGKAFILNEATRLLKNMTANIKCLRKENAKLLSESHYVTVEKNELKDENSALETQIEKLQCEVEACVQSGPYLNIAPSDAHQSEMLLHPPEDHLRLPASHQVPLMCPVFVIPNGHDLPVYKEPENAHHTARPTSNVSKPNPRYPNPLDSWPSQLLGGLSKGRV